MTGLPTRTVLLLLAIAAAVTFVAIALPFIPNTPPLRGMIR